MDGADGPGTGYVYMTLGNVFAPYTPNGSEPGK